MGQFVLPRIDEARGRSRRRGHAARPIATLQAPPQGWTSQLRPIVIAIDSVDHFFRALMGPWRLDAPRKLLELPAKAATSTHHPAIQWRADALRARRVRARAFLSEDRGSMRTDLMLRPVVARAGVRPC